MSTLNIDAMDEAFDISTQEQMDRVHQMRQELEDSVAQMEDGLDPDQLLIDNIERANRLLNRLEDSIERGSEEPRMFEVAGQLINAVTTASNSIAGTGLNQAKFDLENRKLEIKEKELMIKQAISQNKKDSLPSGSTQNNVILSDRESLLDMIHSMRRGKENVIDS